MTRTLTVGDAVPDVEVSTVDGELTRLEALRGPRRTAYVFVRHLG